MEVAQFPYLAAAEKAHTSMVVAQETVVEVEDSQTVVVDMAVVVDTAVDRTAAADTVVEAAVGTWIAVLAAAEPGVAAPVGWAVNPEFLP